jgi:hypothetical protein
MAKVSEKTLELNVGAEILQIIRSQHGCSRAFLRGLTQAEEHAHGVDFYAELPNSTRVYAFQFKAPKKKPEGEPYLFTVRRDQHTALYRTASGNPGSVFYCFPYYVETAKLVTHLPTLLTETWLLDVASVAPTVFGTNKSKTVRCQGGVAQINPEYKLISLVEIKKARKGVKPLFGEGLTLEMLQEMLKMLLKRPGAKTRLSSWLTRELRAVFVLPESRDIEYG